MVDIISILHISDLHRSKEFQISNSALLSSLISDRDKYTQTEFPKIKFPDIIIVSGDIVRGSTNPNVTESLQELSDQYLEAEEFLNDITTHFLGGDKSKIIIIPGNHDIDWKYSKASMEKIDNTKVFDASNNLKWEILQESIHPDSLTRWSWKELSFFKIKDIPTYNKRLEAFSNFYVKFYEGKRKYSLDPAEQYDLFDYPLFNLSIVAYNSCHNNDHLRFVGDIHPDCISNSSLKIRELIKRGRLIIGTWHHNTKGGPNESNYMDNSRLKNFIDSQIIIGFHGHQHKMEVINEYNDVIEQKKITVFSAGTLCGGPKDLPTGSNRQYNLIELNSEKDRNIIKITLHVREKSESSSFTNPIWTAGRIDSKNISYYSFEIVDPRKVDISTVLLDIAKLIGERHYDKAKEALLKMDVNDEFVRKFLTECIVHTDDFALALEIFSKPKSNKEIIVVLDAATQLKNSQKIKEILNEITDEAKSDPSVREIIKKAKVQLHD
jgi:predicted phosphodiesterase